MSPKENPACDRQRLLIDQPVQGALLFRSAIYSFACGLYFVLTMIFGQRINHPDQTWLESTLQCLEESIYWAPGLILITPMIALDILKVSNRFAGPMFRLRREMQRLSGRESEWPLDFRGDDYWTELAPIFNKIRTELMELRDENETLRQQVAEAAAHTVPTDDSTANEDNDTSIDAGADPVSRLA